MKAVVFTLGCKVNEVESASMMAALEGAGWETDDCLSPADAYILNTCAVTKEAERKSRQLIARARKYNSGARVYVCGCASQKDSEQFKKLGVDFVCGASDKQALLTALCNDFNTPLAQMGYPKRVKTRAFIKIEDGCDNFCSYCVIPYLRGRVRSRSVEEVVKEVASTDAPEIVLTGINVSAYGGEGGLTALIKALSFCPKRIRLGSLECNVIDEGLLSALCALPDFAPQFHLSLQSGSNAVLKAMNRRYTREEYLQKCRLIYSFFPDVAITTDIIAGFCGESEEDFLQSLSIIKEAGLARVHCFAFSPREGTRAFTLPDVDANVKSDRLHRLIDAGKKAEEEYVKKRLGREYAVIFEDFDGEYTSGYTAGYIKIYIKGKYSGKANVTLLKPFEDGVLAALSQR